MSQNTEQMSVEMCSAQFYFTFFTTHEMHAATIFNLECYLCFCSFNNFDSNRTISVDSINVNRCIRSIGWNYGHISLWCLPVVYVRFDCLRLPVDPLKNWINNPHTHFKLFVEFVNCICNLALAKKKITVVSRRFGWRNRIVMVRWPQTRERIK